MNTEGPLKGKAILLVDDQVEFREILRGEFELEGARVFEASDSEQAFRVALEQPLDLVVSELQMPGGGGRELLKKLRARDAQRPAVILISNFMENLGADEGLGSASLVFSKPFTHTFLVDAAVRLLIPTGPLVSVRRAERFPAQVKIAVQGSGIRSFYTSSTVNISKGGAFVKMAGEVVPKVGDQLQFRFLNFDGDFLPIEGKARCRWLNSQGFGMEFEYLDPPSLQKFTSLLQEVGSGQSVGG